MIWLIVDYGKMKNSKKSQVKIQQMAFVLIAVTLFLTIVILFFLKFAFLGIKDTATELQEKNAILLISKLANSPEFSCDEGFGSKKTNCVDFDKVISLKENINNYYDFWGVSNIEIRKILSNGNLLCTSLNYPNCDFIRIYDKEIEGYGIDNFISLCRKEFSSELGIYDKCEIAKMTVFYKEK
jgi:hypothetical protein